jgi:hypothetical protein
MTAQQHADHLLAVWQQRRDLPPSLRLIVAIKQAPEPANQNISEVESDLVLAAVSEALA